MLKTLLVVTLGTSSLTSYGNELHCYSDIEQEKIASAISDLYLCETTLDEKEIFIEQNLRKYADSGPSFWQEPTFLVAGVAVSFSVGLIAGFVLSR